jgi:hypothetical protein
MAATPIAVTAITTAAAAAASVQWCRTTSLSIEAKYRCDAE